MRVLLVDDHAVVRDGIKRILEKQPGGFVFGEAATGQEALELIRREAWDAVVLDISLGTTDGLRTLRDVRRMRPRLPVLVLTMHPEEQYARRAFREGAAGYVTKGSSRREIVEAIQRIVSGRKYVSPLLAERLTDDLQRGARGPLHDRLSDRELEVMRLIGSGKTVSEIAGLLSLSDSTISTYRARILEKTGMSTNAEITRYVIENSLSG